MIHAALRETIKEELIRVTGTGITAIQFTPVGGGSINYTYRLDTNNHLRFFCKVNSLSRFPALFRAEKSGLELLAGQQVIRIPRVITLLETAAEQVLIMEWIEQGLRTAGFWKNFGERLAALHNCTGETFGLPENNYMGALPQYNTVSADWCAFFQQQRLEPQVQLAMEKGLLDARWLPHFGRLYVRLPGIFYPAPPGLLHGDLWSGNFLCDEQQQPVLIDPAAYYGHHIIDIAMTTLFGGFDQGFYDSYHAVHPASSGFRHQCEIANLYPLLVHLNLFGESYLPGILHTIQRY